MVINVYVRPDNKRMDINVTGITLLSIKEYEATWKHIPELADDWWLRTPGYSNTGKYDSEYVACIETLYYDSSRKTSYINKSGYLATSSQAVRPALQLDRKLLSLHIDDRFSFADHTWFYIGKGLAICEDALCKMPFRIDYKAEDQNVYEWSDVAAYLERWLSDAMEQHGGKLKDPGKTCPPWIPASRYSLPEADGETLVTIHTGSTERVTSAMFRVNHP